MRMSWLRNGLFMGLALLVPATAWSSEGADKTIVEIAAGNKNFTKLVAALKAAGLVDALSGEGPFTVFAPTDAAFEALGEDTLKAVLADKKKLTAILTYHVIKGNVPSKDALALAKDGKSAKTLNGAEIALSIKDGSLYLNDSAKVVKTDIIGKNGIIHVIDKVILPPAGKSSRVDPATQNDTLVEVDAAPVGTVRYRERGVVFHRSTSYVVSDSCGTVIPMTRRFR